MWGISTEPKRGGEKDGREQRRRGNSRARLGTNGDRLPEKPSGRPRVHEAIQEIERFAVFVLAAILPTPPSTTPVEGVAMKHGGGRGGMEEIGASAARTLAHSVVVRHERGSVVARRR